MTHIAAKTKSKLRNSRPKFFLKISADFPLLSRIYSRPAQAFIWRHNIGKIFSLWGQHDIEHTEGRINK